MPSTSASPGEKRGGKDFAAPGPADRWFPALWERELAREGKEPGAAVSALWRIKWAAKGCAEVAFLLRPDDKKGSGGRSFGGRGGDANTSLSSRGGRGGCQDHRQPRPRCVAWTELPLPCVWSQRCPPCSQPLWAASVPGAPGPRQEAPAATASAASTLPAPVWLRFPSECVTPASSRLWAPPRPTGSAWGGDPRRPLQPGPRGRAGTPGAGPGPALGAIGRWRRLSRVPGTYGPPP